MLKSGELTVRAVMAAKSKIALPQSEFRQISILEFIVIYAIQIITGQ